MIDIRTVDERDSQPTPACTSCGKRTTRQPFPSRFHARDENRGIKFPYYDRGAGRMVTDIRTLDDINRAMKNRAEAAGHTLELYDGPGDVVREDERTDWGDTAADPLPAGHPGER